MEEVLLGSEGTLISYTVQRYPPPPPFVSPEPFVPMAVGTVALPEGIQIPGQIKGVDHDVLAVGMDVRVVVDTLFVDGEGGEALTWWFEPA